MSTFTFVTDAESEEFCREIAQEMQELFGITEAEALGRINRHWKGLELLGSEDLIYHEDQVYWAKTIYYGKDSFWWLDESKTMPLPFP